MSSTRESTGQQRRRHHVVLDFDSTMTKEDTIAGLFALARESLATKEEKYLYDKKHADVLQWYMSSYNEMTKKTLDSVESALRDGRLRQVSAEALAPLFEPLEEFERTSVERVVESKLLAGISQERLAEQGTQLPLHEHCADAARAMRDSGLSMSILSVNWSRDLIASVCSRIFANEGSSINDRSLPPLPISSNDLVFDAGVCTGDIAIQHTGARQKLARFVKDTTLPSVQVSSRETDATFNATSYIGDSLTDLLCLLQSDVGIIVGQSSSLTQFLTVLGLEAPPLSQECRSIDAVTEEVLREKDANKRRGGVLYRAESWSDIKRFYCS